VTVMGAVLWLLKKVPLPELLFVKVAVPAVLVLLIMPPPSSSPSTCPITPSRRAWA